MPTEDPILKEKHFDAAISQATSPTDSGRRPDHTQAEDETEREEQFAKRARVVSKTLEDILHRFPPRPPSFGINE